MHVTCGPNGPSPGDVIGGMSPFSSAKEQYAGFGLVCEGRSNTFNWLTKFGLCPGSKPSTPALTAFQTICE